MSEDLEDWIFHVLMFFQCKRHSEGSYASAKDKAQRDYHLQRVDELAGITRQELRDAMTRRQERRQAKQAASLKPESPVETTVTTGTKRRTRMKRGEAKSND